MNNILEFILNTPEEYWVVIFGFHLKKAFWGILCLITGVSLFYFSKKNKTLKYGGIIFLIFGCLLIIIGTLGNIYTNNLPYFKLWSKY